MLDAIALKPILEKTLMDYCKATQPADKVEQATLLVELATASFCTVAACLGYESAIVLSARMQSDLMALYERNMPNATHKADA